jgi:hypothetical protein
MATTIPSAVLVPTAPVFTNTERLALAGFLAGYSGLTQRAYELDLRQLASWCQQHHLRLFQARRAESSSSPATWRPAGGPGPLLPGACARWLGSTATPSRKNSSITRPRRMCGDLADRLIAPGVGSLARSWLGRGESSGVRSSRRNLLALVAVVAVIAVTVAVIVRIQSSSHPVDTATVYSGDLAVVAIAVTLLLAVAGWRWKNGSRRGGISSAAQVAAAAERLAEVMADRWRREAAIRRITTPAPITVQWQWAAEGVTAPRPDIATAPVPGAGPVPLPDLAGQGGLLDSGVVGRLHDEMYARLPHGRLVVLGAPGAGKTGAMVLLLLAALERRALLADEQRKRVPVPVWLTMGRWDPADTSLHEWAVATMNRDHPALRAPEYGPDAAGELLRGGRVALFLDGLDEMPEGVRTQAMRRVNEEARGLRIVLTSRPAEFWHAVQASRPDNTAVIELRPVQVAAAATYLLHGQPRPNRERWEVLGIYLKQYPESVAARALDNPLALSAARDTYAGQDPVVLTDADMFPSVRGARASLDPVADQCLCG